jgi:Lrp/AsnC family leucine-responsive transcriptional regulator
LIVDSIDSKILELLSVEGRMSWADLGQQLGLSPPAAAERVKRLRRSGAIRSFAALLEPRVAGGEVLAFVGVTFERPADHARFVKRVAGLREVLECHHVAGEDDYLLKVRCAHLQALERLVAETLKGLAGGARTRTTVALSTAKEEVLRPLTAPARHEAPAARPARRK